ncbi:DgyrCDS5901 [Dimorphilus gyrociliatus]|uniref:DgyrCDS5901 n=1 Tax=Dimorphilus gyrociliatus TaxID=2664684 RepID=A0A7I8VM48_9ANNE|nr:DgyrCDS5901 [Dimorphilus gyrociliatus]
MHKYILILLIVIISSLYGEVVDLRKEARWCVKSDAEEAKCNKLVQVISRAPLVDKYAKLPKLECIRGTTSFDCMSMIGQNDADLVTLDAGMGYTAGEYFSMMPLMNENYDSSGDPKGRESKVVAVVRKDNSDITYKTLKGKKACSPGVGHAVGWVHPISTLIQDTNSEFEIKECNVPVKSAAAFFGPMCAPNGLAKFYNPFGNNPVSICKNCDESNKVTYCTDNDKYANYHGAFECMSSKRGDVAFVRDTTITMATGNGTSSNDFELLCVGEGRKSWNEFENCNWGTVKSHIVMTSAVNDADTRNEYKKLLQTLSDDFKPNGANENLFELFESRTYGGRDLLFSDETKLLEDVKDKDSYYTWVGKDYRNILLRLNDCPVKQTRWCVISPFEMKKCESMIMALSAKNLKPDFNCILGENGRDCMAKLRDGDADLMSLDPADIYVGGKYYGLVPIAREDYSGYEEAPYYAVAVARKIGSYLTIFNLKGRRACHAAVYTAAGWVSPIDTLVETGQIRVEECNAYRAMGEFFSKSCAPGVLNSQYNTDNTNPINLCEACASGGLDRCLRNDRELYYGNSGAFRCLTEFGGDVAFIKHTTVRENTDGRNRAEWARNRRSDDYELLCKDGTRKPIDNWKDCHLTEIPASAVVTASFKTTKQREIYWTLLNYAQQFFASDENKDFQMFDSFLDHKDLMFEDSTVRLALVPPERQNYKDYLKPAFVRAMERLQEIDCVTASSSTFHLNSIVALLCLLIMKFIFS